MEEFATLKPFKCKRCGNVLAETNGDHFRAVIESVAVEVVVWVKECVFECVVCGLKRNWRSNGKRDERDKIRP